MHYLKQMARKNGEDGVSPVIGVMLMLVVTIIIAAVISGFAGGLVGDTKKSPSLTMDITITNTGYYATSGFTAKILSVTEPIPTSNLKLVTSWTHQGTSGGATSLPLNKASSYSYNSTSSSSSWSNLSAPFGFGTAVQGSNSGVPTDNSQQFGNYTLSGGTIMLAFPAGQAGGYGGSSSSTSGYGVSSQYEYTTGSPTDAMQSVLGTNWNILRTGDPVTVKLVYTPTGAVIYQKNVVVS